ncbi:MAG: pitrilysin family protein [Deltaproteobacteria bacterium]|nr:pitrilysin family protein [Deltaproteobacteria bacterium]
MLKRTTPEGLTILALESRAAPVVAVQVWVGVGSADETDAEAGLAHVHEHMLFKGTVKNGVVRRGVGEIASAIEGAGGDINAWTSYDQTVYHVVIAKDFFDTGLDVLADAVQHSAFEKDELARELEVILEEIKRSEDSPGSRVSKGLFAEAFLQHPYRRPVIGYRDIVAAFTRDDVTAFFKAHYRADRLTVVVVGDIDAGVAVDKVEAAFSDTTRGARALTPRPHEASQNGLRVRGLTDDVEESHLAVAFRGPSLLDAVTPALDVLGIVLGQGDSSRLSRSIKREKQLANEVYSYAYTPKDPGLFVVGATLNHEKLDLVLPAIGHELRRVQDGIAPAEIEKAKAILASESVYQRETVEGLARRLGTWQLLTGDPAYEAEYNARVQKVTVEDVVAAARAIFDPSQATIVALVPKAEEARVNVDDLKEKAHQALRPRVRRQSVVQSNITKETVKGTRVVVEHDPTNPIVAVRAAWLGGLRAEDDATSGYTHLCSELVSKGTATRTATEIADYLDRTAGGLDGFAGRNSFGLRQTVLTPNLQSGLELFFDVWNHVAFSDDELTRQKEHTLEDLRARADNPAGLAFDQFHQALWKTHPYRRDLLGTPETVKAATSSALSAFWRARARCSDAVLCFVGDIDPDRAFAFVDEHLHADDGVPPPQPPAEADPTSSAVVRLVRDRAQAHLVTGVRGLTLRDPDRYGLELLVAALSGQGGRLFLELRDKQSLCYSVAAYAVDGLEPGSFSVYMGTSPDKVERALEGINKILQRIVDEGIPEAELKRGQRYLTGSHAISLQRTGARATTMSLNELYGLGHLAHHDHLKKLALVTVDDVRRVAQKVLTRTRITSIVGPEGTGGPASTT